MRKTTADIASGGGAGKAARKAERRSSTAARAREQTPHTEHTVRAQRRREGTVGPELGFIKPVAGEKEDDKKHRES